MATAPSNILSVGRLLCFVAGSFYGMSKVGSLQSARDKLDLEMVKKWDQEQLNLPESKRHYLGIYFDIIY